ncbi:MAG: ABC transporter substrate-binding protein, partial [Burkholderiaceae bacterium]
MKIQMKMQMNKAVKPSTNQADSLAIMATPSTVATQAVLTTRTRASCHAVHGWFKTLWLSAALAFAAGSAIADQGVSSNEILLGTIQDLSGPLAGYGKAGRNGMQMRMDEINEQGGVNGRKLRLVTEDSGYDPKRAVLAAQKLVNQDKIFMMLAHIGTA